MRIRNKKTGQIFESVDAAVEAFRCPGPCNPDCPLYGLVSLSPTTVAHKCHPEYVRKSPGDVISLMGCDIAGPGGVTADDKPDKDETFIALIKSGAVRDAQICKNALLDAMDEDSWYDMTDAEVYLGVFRGKLALQTAASYANTDTQNIRLIPIAEL